MTDMAGVVLCGGAGRRIGADKATITFDGVPLVERVAGRLAPIADPVFVARGGLDPLDVPYVHLQDAMPGSGPLGAIVAALRASPKPFVAVAAVDMPFVSAEVFARLRAAWRDEDAMIPEDEFGPQVLHALYAASALRGLESALERRELSVVDALAGMKVRRVLPGDPVMGGSPAGFARNINSLGDVAGLEGHHELRISHRDG